MRWKTAGHCVLPIVPSLVVVHLEGNWQVYKSDNSVLIFSFHLLPWLPKQFSMRVRG